MVKEIFSLPEFEQELRYPGLVVVDFFTTWCGPCKMIAPFIEQLSQKYPEVKFIKVDIEKNEAIAAPRRISSIPTFHFIVNGRVVEEMKGANPQQLEQKVIQHKVNTDPFGGSAGHKLSSDSNLDPREARLRAMAGGSNPMGGFPAPGAVPPPAVPYAAPSSVGPDPTVVFKKAQEEAADLAAAEKAFAEQEKQQNQLKTYNAPVENEEMLPVPVDEEILSQLTEMGFDDTRARKSIYHGKNLEGALAWIDEHQDDPDIDQPFLVKQSDLTAKAAPISEEEKKRKVEELRLKIKNKREEQQKKEKEEEIKREKERREKGQAVVDARAEREQMMRKTEAEKVKKEKLVRELHILTFAAFFL
jgi:thioredoxin